MLHHVLLFCICWFVLACGYSWLPKEAAEWAIQEFEKREANRGPISGRIDRRSSSPFITGNGLRDKSQHVCDETTECRMNPMDVKDGDIIFIKSDCYEQFANKVMPHINSKFTIVSHNGDLSSPDGQMGSLHRDGKVPSYVTSHLIRKAYESGQLIAHHGQNIWWVSKNNNYTNRPEMIHCIPIGLENRQYPVGRRIHNYVNALRVNVVNRPNLSLEEERKKPLLLVAFGVKDYAPDRFKVLQYLGAMAIPDNQLSGHKRPTKPFYHEAQMNHEEWLDSINQHRFVLAPFGHGLDTHRISEILLMGGIPVMRRSTISSCFDDSDNTFNNHTRGSLPVVILESWDELTPERLEQEWDRITRYPQDHWDWHRLFLDHWLQRIGFKQS